MSNHDFTPTDRILLLTQFMLYFWHTPVIICQARWFTKNYCLHGSSRQGIGNSCSSLQRSIEIRAKMPQCVEMPTVLLGVSSSTAFCLVSLTCRQLEALGSIGEICAELKNPLLDIEESQNHAFHLFHTKHKDETIWRKRIFKDSEHRLLWGLMLTSEKLGSGFFCLISIGLSNPIVPELETTSNSQLK